ncbi:hypothetical protein [Psychromicrobium lacuslunae]|nr:hypothetical protein [Psychromicrobium lacuslunae]
MTDLQARTADFLDCVFTGKLDQVTFFGKSDIDDPLSPLRQNEVAGNDFSNADIGDINFLAGVKLEAQKLPRGGDYMVINNAESVLNKARFDALRMNNTDRGLEIIKTIDVFSEVVAGGQADIFVSKRRVPNYLKSTFDDFFDFMLPYLSHKFGSA